MKRYAVGAVIAGLLFLSPAPRAQTPPDRLAMDLEPQILEVLDDHGQTLAVMAETVIEIRDNMATRDHAQAITSNLAAIRARLDQSVPTPEPIPAAGSSVLTTPTISASVPLAAGERVIAIDGVPVNSIEPAPLSTVTVKTPFREITATGVNPYVSSGVVPRASVGCYTNSAGERVCPSYNPSSVSTPANDSRRFRLFRRR